MLLERTAQNAAQDIGLQIIRTEVPVENAATMKRNNFFLIFSVFCFSMIAIERIIGSYLVNYSLSTLFAQLGILFLGLFFVYRKDLRTTLRELNIPGNLKTAISWTAIGLVVIFVGGIIIGLIATEAKINDQSKVVEKVNEFSYEIILMAIILAPIGEELLFRGFLTKRFGVIISALIFGAVHLAYGSYFEIIGIVYIGLVLAYVFQKTKSLTPCILIHFLHNLFNLLAMIILRGAS